MVLRDPNYLKEHLFSDNCVLPALSSVPGIQRNETRRAYASFSADCAEDEARAYINISLAYR